MNDKMESKYPMGDSRRNPTIDNPEYSASGTRDDRFLRGMAFAPKDLVKQTKSSNTN